MTHLSLDQVVNLLIQYKYLILFPLVVFEGPITTIITGFLTSLGYFNFLVTYILIVFADLVGDVVYYYFGRLGREHFINRWGRFLGISMERVKKLEKHFERHTGKTLILGKLSHAVGGYILVAAGVAKIPLQDFIKYNFIATWPKSLVLFLIGYYFGRSYYQISKYLDYTAWGTIALVIILIVVYFIMKTKAEREFK